MTHKNQAVVSLGDWCVTLTDFGGCLGISALNSFLNLDFDTILGKEQLPKRKNLMRNFGAGPFKSKSLRKSTTAKKRKKKDFFSEESRTHAQVCFFEQLGRENVRSLDSEELIQQKHLEIEELIADVTAERKERIEEVWVKEADGEDTIVQRENSIKMDELRRKILENFTKDVHTQEEDFKEEAKLLLLEQECLPEKPLLMESYDPMPQRVENLCSLPEELQLYILSFLPPLEVVFNVQLVNKHLRMLSKDDSLWHNLHKRYFGGPKRRDRTWRQESYRAGLRLRRHLKKHRIDLILWASKHGYTNFVKNLLERYKPKLEEVKRPGGATPLHLACEAGHEEIVKLLLENNAKVNCRTTSGRTPLGRAAKNGHVGIVKLLLENNAHVNVKGGSGVRETPLLVASGNNHPEIVQILLENGADPNVHCAGFTAFRIASLQGYTGIADLLANYSHPSVASSSVPSRHPPVNANH
eukprot:CAMPEP_0174254622 /NCGR_PEP_ID=MMETSP0439-20130205/3945_1 /TAXON_ID=0 /ORGANISM="Stereomyxa ramosa, Strain Chinc5" /LENGTH=469 /DNA_ID=CAMNT_0015336321 /DNA_START=33 /DNA_END=1442 /DNA_ORIENTATION=-